MPVNPVLVLCRLIDWTKMGCTPSKKSAAFSQSAKGDSSEVKSDVETLIDEETVNVNASLDKKYVDDIKKDLSDNPEMFVLNNMLMAVMFFENYPRLVKS